MIEIDPREEKLPVWTQRLIGQLRYDAQRARDDLEAHRASETPTRIYYGLHNNPVFVPDDDGYQRVHFALGERDLYDQIAVSITRDGKSLYLNGGRGMSVKMDCSNAFHVRLED